MYSSTRFTSSFCTVPWTVTGRCARIRNSTCGGTPASEGNTLILATSALCRSNELMDEDGAGAKSDGAISSAAAAEMSADLSTETTAGAIGLECCSHLGPNNPTEKPIITKSAALHAGSGESQFAGRKTP